jgi:translation initiation factor 5A
MTTNAVPATRLKVGDLILLDGEGDNIFKIKKLSTSAPGKHGHAKVRIDYTNIFTGSGGGVVYSGHKEIEKPVIEKEKSQVLSVTPSQKSNDPKIRDKPAVVQLMNLETYETYDLEVPSDINENDLQAGVELDIRYYESKKWIERIAP